MLMTALRREDRPFDCIAHRAYRFLRALGRNRGAYRLGRHPRDAAPRESGDDASRDDADYQVGSLQGSRLRSNEKAR